jgi:hypothetical protein
MKFAWITQLSDTDLADRIEHIGAVWRTRREGALDESIRALRPAEIDWSTPEEREEMQALAHEHTRRLGGREEAAARVQQKRAARRAALGVPGQTTSFAAHVMGIEFEGRRAHRLVCTDAPYAEIRATLERARDHAEISLRVLAVLEAKEPPCE